MAATLTEDSVSRLKGKLCGRIITPNDCEYDNARKVYNAMINKRPQLIAYCVDVASPRRFGTALQSASRERPRASTPWFQLHDK